MFRRFAYLALTLMPAVSAAQSPPAEAPLRFRWQENQVLTYKVSQQTRVRETTLDEKTEKPVSTEARTELTLLKKWTVKSIDMAGVATLEMAITEMKNTIYRPDGSTIVLDSANPADAKSMSEYLNVPILKVRVDARGSVIEVKEAKGGSAGRLQAELPFRMILPETGPRVGQSWERTFTRKLDPPAGTGETYDYRQRYTCTSLEKGLAAATVATSLEAPPRTISEQVPLVPLLWTGEVYFNAGTGRYHAARLKVKADLPNHQGEGTRFEYESVYSEDAVEK
jgi:hypothetical protein